MWLRGKESDEPSGWVAVQVTFKKHFKCFEKFFGQIEKQIVAENQRYKLDPKFEAKKIPVSLGQKSSSQKVKFCRQS